MFVDPYDALGKCSAGTGVFGGWDIYDERSG